MFVRSPLTFDFRFENKCSTWIPNSPPAQLLFGTPYFREVIGGDCISANFCDQILGEYLLTRSIRLTTLWTSSKHHPFGPTSSWFFLFSQDFHLIIAIFVAISITFNAKFPDFRIHRNSSEDFRISSDLGYKVERSRFSVFRGPGASRQFQKLP